jgi:O-antigen/teichoic acid export membrane protein
MRRLVENYAFVLAADVLQRLSGALVVVWVSRRLGVAEAGVYFLALTFATLFGRVTYWGLDQLLTREVARQPARGNQFLVNFLAVRGALSVVMLVVLVAVVEGLGYGPHASRVILLLGLTIVPDSLINICQSLFVAYEAMGYLAVAAFFNGAARVLAAALALGAGLGLEGVAVSLVLASGITLALLVYLVRAHLFTPTWQMDWQFCRRQLGVALPFLLIGLFYILENRLDVVLLSELADQYQVGLYGAASTVIEALVLIPFAFQRVVFPVMSRLYATAPEMLERLYDQSFKYLLLAGLPTAVSLTLLAPDVMVLVFGVDFAPGTVALQLLVWGLLLVFINVPNSRLLVVADRQTAIAGFLLLSLVVNVALNVALIPRWGAAGAGVARIASTLVLFVVATGFVRRRLYRFNPLPMLPRPLLAAAAMAGALVALRAWPLLALIPAGAAVYLATLVLLRTFARDDLQLWRQVAVRQPVE